MRISESKIEEIRNAVDIVDLIGEFVQLRKRGKNFIGLCPFHTEKTPSFTVNEEKQIFHCFGCHTGGNAFKFLMEYEKISFVEAVQELAEKGNITLEFDSYQSSEQQSETEILYDLNSLAARYFSDNLLKEEEGTAAREYFTGRKIKSPILRSFGLGYSPRTRDALVNHLISKKVDLEKAVELGLILKGNDNKLVDRFYGRLIFPIFSPNGRVVAFAGRVFDESDKLAKYVNSPESQIYHKGRILYGLSFAKDEIRKLNKVILVEGYMDLISLYQAGIKNVVAVSGTALTDDQAMLLSRYSKNVYLLFDSDTAGIKASMRSIEILLRRDMEIKIVTLPAGEDPDSYVTKFGPEKFEDEIDRAENFLEYQTRYYHDQGMFRDPAKSAEAIRELVKPFVLIRDDLKRQLLIKSIAGKFNLREKLIESEVDKLLRKKVQTEQSTGPRPQPGQNKDQKERVNLVIYNVEKEIIKLLFEGNYKIVELIRNNLYEEEFILPIHEEIKIKVIEVFDEDGDLTAASLIDKFTDEKVRQYILKVTFDEYQISRNWTDFYEGETEKNLLKSASDIIKKFKFLKIEEQINSEHAHLEKTPAEEDKIKIIKTIRDLRAEQQKIKEE
jgi:DNA primase